MGCGKHNRVTNMRYIKESKSLIGTLIGAGWFFVWLIGGAVLLQWLSNTQPRMFSTFLPLWFFIWVFSLFFGRAAIASFARKFVLSRHNATSHVDTLGVKTSFLSPRYNVADSIQSNELIVGNTNRLGSWNNTRVQIVPNIVVAHYVGCIEPPILDNPKGRSYYNDVYGIKDYYNNSVTENVTYRHVA